jgi:hypothetical protein
VRAALCATTLSSVRVRFGSVRFPVTRLLPRHQLGNNVAESRVKVEEWGGRGMENEQCEVAFDRHLKQSVGSTAVRKAGSRKRKQGVGLVDVAEVE